MTYKALLLATVMVHLAPNANSAEPLIPVESFVNVPEYTSPRISPDGKHIALNVRLKRNGRMIPTMTVYTLPDLKVVSTIAMNGFEIPLRFNWVTNQRLIVSKGLEIGLREPPVATGELVAVDLDGKNQEYLYGYKNYYSSSKGAKYNNDYGYGELVDVPEPRNGSVLVGTYLWRAERSQLYSINTVNANRKLVADIGAEYLDFMIQNDGKPRFAFGSDDHYDPVLYRLDDTSGEWKIVKDKSLGSRYSPLAFTADDSEVYALYSAAGGPETVVRDSMKGTARTLVAEDSFGSINIRQYTAKPARLFGVGTQVGIPKLRYVDETIPEAKLHKDLASQFPDSFVTFINFTDDGNTLLFSVASDKDPGSFYLLNRKSGKADLLFSNLTHIEPETMAERRPVQFTSRDGLPLTGYLTIPKSNGKKAPLIFIPHGGPQGIMEDWFFDLDAQFLASRGYAVLQLNFRGSGGRGVKFQNAGQREWGGKMIDDMVDGVKWAGKLPEIDGSRVCAFGGSYGGYASLMLAVREPTMFKCVVGYAGLYDLHHLFDEQRVISNKKTKNFYTRWLGTDKDELTRYSPALNADKIKTPVLIVHGEKDETCPIEHAHRMRAALTKAGRPPEWMQIANEGHGFYDVENRRAFYLKLEEFFGKHLGK